MIESTLRFDDVQDIPGFLPLLRVVQRSHLRSRERSGRRPENEATFKIITGFGNEHLEKCVCLKHSFFVGVGVHSCMKPWLLVLASSQFKEGMQETATFIFFIQLHCSSCDLFRKISSP